MMGFWLQMQLHILAYTLHRRIGEVGHDKDKSWTVNDVTDSDNLLLSLFPRSMHTTREWNVQFDQLEICFVLEIRWRFPTNVSSHYGDVIMGTMVSQITSLTIVYSTVYSGAHQRKHQSYASLAFVRGIHREPVNSPHKWPVTRKTFPFDDVIMNFRHKVYHETNNVVFFLEN